MKTQKASCCDREFTQPLEHVGTRKAGRKSLEVWDGICSQCGAYLKLEIERKAARPSTTDKSERDET